MVKNILHDLYKIDLANESDLLNEIVDDIRSISNEGLKQLLAEINANATQQSNTIKKLYDEQNIMEIKIKTMEEIYEKIIEILR